jgi:hypothetical protein
VQDPFGHGAQLLRRGVLRFGQDQPLRVGALPGVEAARQPVQRLTDRRRLTHTDPTSRCRIPNHRPSLQPAGRPHHTGRFPGSLLPGSGHPVHEPGMAGTHRRPGIVSLGHQHRRQSRHPTPEVTDLIDPPQPLLIRRRRPIHQTERLQHRPDLLQTDARIRTNHRSGRRECCRGTHTYTLNEHTDKKDETDPRPAATNKARVAESRTPRHNRRSDSMRAEARVGNGERRSLIPARS